MRQDYDIIIVGGGLAGLTAALHLSQSAHSILLIEKNEYPKHKVCGEYVSNEVLPYLKRLGVDPIAHGAKEITKFAFSGLSGEVLRIDLPLGGFGISRYALDYMMYNKLIENGVTVERASVLDITYCDEMFEVAITDKSYRTPHVIGAYGKRSTLDITLSRKFISTRSPWLGVKAHYEADFPEDEVALHNFKGGYCGLSKVETDAVNVCYLADVASFKKYKDLDTYRVEVLEKNKELKSFFAKAKPLFNKPLTISQISFQNKQTVENHILMIGDSAGLIHPLCGNGMAMAIHSAKIASECLLEYLSYPKSRAHLEQNYTKQWKAAFTTRMRNGAIIQRGLQSDTITKVGVRVLQQSPRLLTKIITSTHGKNLL
ncbi:MAG: flavin-dependent dehydrogenase [Dokdonia donghaensis]|nr:NAD(P)/FAD-dependent oxidoreductase [Dokdonia donghaensis]